MGETKKNPEQMVTKEIWEISVGHSFRNQMQGSDDDYWTYKTSAYQELVLRCTGP